MSIPFSNTNRILYSVVQQPLLVSAGRYSIAHSLTTCWDVLTKNHHYHYHHHHNNNKNKTKQKLPVYSQITGPWLCSCLPCCGRPCHVVSRNRRKNLNMVRGRAHLSDDPKTPRVPGLAQPLGGWVALSSSFCIPKLQGGTKDSYTSYISICFKVMKWPCDQGEGDVYNYLGVDHIP